jgi:hypothetical protein
MKAKHAHNKAWLLSTAKVLAIALKPNLRGAHWSIRIPKLKHVYETETDGWAVRINRGAADRPRLEVWLDRFTKHSERKLYVGFRIGADVSPAMKKAVAGLSPHRVIKDKETSKGKLMQLLKPLPRSEFNHPIRELYRTHEWFGLFDFGRSTASSSSRFLAHTLSQETLAACSAVVV